MASICKEPQATDVATRGLEESPAPDLLAVLLEQTRSGSSTAYADLIKLCRRYLVLMARDDFPDDLKAKIAPSDIVQESLLEMQRGFRAFRGRKVAELLAWLRAILRHNMTDAVRYYKATQKRLVDREVPFGTPSHWRGSQRDYVDDTLTPAASLVQWEKEHAIRQAIDELPEDYRTVIHLHYWEQLSFEQVGQEMNRSAEAARKLWYRAIEEIRQRIRQSYGSESG